MPVSPVVAGQKLEELARTLGDSGPLLADRFAQEVLLRAQARAQSGPPVPPQAKIVGPTAFVKNGIVQINTRQRVGRRGTPAGKIAGGSEFGQKKWPQFKSPWTTKGYWMYPSRDEVNGDPVFLARVDKEFETFLAGVETFGSSIQLFGQILKVIVAI